MRFSVPKERIDQNKMKPIQLLFGHTRREKSSSVTIVQ